METRKIELLTQIIEEYIKSASPVGSKFIAQKTSFELSPATIRNEMADLERDGYIYQPHPSAGRAPTEKGYKYYLENYLSKFKLAERDKKILDKIIRETIPPSKVDDKLIIKELAKKIANLVKEAVLVGFSPEEFYYTGLSNVFSQPEFQLQERVVYLSEIVDHLDQVMAKIYPRVKETKVLIGKDNPFGVNCSLIITNLEKSTKKIMGIIGPLRMDYQKNYNYIKYLKDHLENYVK